GAGRCRSRVHNATSGRDPGNATGRQTACTTTAAAPGGTAAVVRAERRGCRSASGRGLALLLDLRLLAAQRAQVVQLGATHVTARHDRDRLDGRRVHGERALDADAEADLADGERLADPAALAGDDDALERLDAGAVALDDLDVDLERVTGTELRDVAAQRCCVDAVQRVHDASPRPPQVGRVLVARERRAGVVSSGCAVLCDHAARPPRGSRGPWSCQSARDPG